MDPKSDERNPNALQN